MEIIIYLANATQAVGWNGALRYVDDWELKKGILPK